MNLRFENDVKEYGIQTKKMIQKFLCAFENDVKEYSVKYKYINDVSIFIRKEPQCLTHTPPDTTITVTLDSELLNEVQSILDEIGIDMETAMVMYLEEIARKKRNPFEVAADACL